MTNHIRIARVSWGADKEYKSEGDAHSYLNVAHTKGDIIENDGEIKLVD